MFIGRSKELKKLIKVVHKKGMGTMLLYGRRRIGKSELAKQLLSECSCKHIYYECKQVSEQSNVNSLAALISEMNQEPLFNFGNIEQVLEYLFKLSIDQELILILDEYPYLRENVRGMDSILQALIDRYRDRANIKLMILGSYVGVMASLIEHANPLYGRMDCVLHLKEMNYLEAAQFYQGFSNEDKVRLYSVFGGVPYYNQLIDPQLSVKDNIIQLIGSDGARLENEITMYLSAEMSKLVNANEVFGALAKGYSKFNDILSQSHVSSSPTLVDVLNRLIEMDVVEKNAPINDENNRKKSSYSICDNLSLFYYRYIFGNSQRKIMDEDVFFEKYIMNDFEENYVPHQFEKICKQYLIDQNIKGNINPLIERIGKYYYDDPKRHRNGEFDIVTQDENGYIFWEVKFKKDKLTEATLRNEIRQVIDTGFKCYKYGFVSRSGFEQINIDNLILLTLDDVYYQG